MNVAFVGASKGMGRALARRMAERGDRLFLLGRDTADLQRSAADLANLGATGEVGVAACDLGDRSTFASALQAARAGLGDVDTIVVTAGAFAQQDALEDDADTLDRLLTVNFTNTIHFCEAARKLLLERGGGRLCVFSSVAGERGRKPVILYGASKAGLSFYLEGLDHKFHDQGLQVITVKPGFVKTGMTAGMDPPPFAGEPDQVAGDVLRAIDRGTPVVYSPSIWRWIMLVIRNLPRLVMRKINF